MIDDEGEFRARFEELREEESRFAPRFCVARPRRRLAPRRLAAVAAALILLVLVVVISVRSRRTTFSASDRAAVRSIAAWHPPTEFLLRTPGSEILLTTPVIPDVHSMKGGL
ncbi:MAG TPA: hypothetical protein VN380_15985 [Thermoanaerobaculia bacterium]|jgi:hypothetical protein|nr:hypothetical protein [Thermoanaerobaculia bacterium]